MTEPDMNRRRFLALGAGAATTGPAQPPTGQPPQGGQPPERAQPPAG